MDLKAEMHALLSSIEDEAARLDLRISLAAIEQGATRLRGRIGVLEERAAGAGADAAHVIFNDAGNFDSQEDGGFGDAMEEDWYGQDNVDEPAQAPAEQQQAPEQQAPEQQAPGQAPAGSRAAEQHGWLLPALGSSRLTARGSRLAARPHGSRLTAHGSRLMGFRY